jgi:two-component system copper resistance phosphate regulon response regulator CusR
VSRILIIEDHRNLVQSLQRGLELLHHEVLVAESAEEGLPLATPDVDLLVLDLMLPGKSGFDVLKELRSAGFTSPILVLTAKDAPEDRRRVQELGADGFLLKPFAFGDLIQRVEALCRAPRHPDPASE